MEDFEVKPFLKWAGGKRQLLPIIRRYYPFDDIITKYVEPFIGGGSVLFDVLGRYELEEVYINDINPELINSYIQLRDNIDEVVSLLAQYKKEFFSYEYKNRNPIYLGYRDKFNSYIINQVNNADKAALMILLNKICFNGLYRVNRKGLFNVSMGFYEEPFIYDEHQLRKISSKLQNVRIYCGDYSQCKDFIDSHSFVYIDPPYRPRSQTSSFTQYTKECFNDIKQIELVSFIDEIHSKGVKFVSSNSDTEDQFFDTVYNQYHIMRVDATRMINCVGSKRGKVKEIMISNFLPKEEV